MRIMTAFDPMSATIGGALIGLAAALLMLLTGRVAGISGILAGCVSLAGGDWRWRAAFIVGLIMAPLTGGIAGYALAEPHMPENWAVVIVAGLLVGFGTKLGGGCTSGHGVCGVSRFSPRSLTATVVFFVTAILVVAVTRHLLGG
jgi:uncharacterized protein